MDGAFKGKVNPRSLSFNATMAYIETKGFCAKNMDFSVSTDFHATLQETVSKTKAHMVVGNLDVSQVPLLKKGAFTVVPLGEKRDGIKILLKGSGPREGINYFDLEGELSFAEKQLIIDIPSFRGSYRGVPWSILSPMRANIQDYENLDEFKVFPFEIECSKAKIKAFYEQRGQALKSTFYVENFELGDLVVWNPDFPLFAYVSGYTEIDGTFKDPRIKLAFTLRDFKNTLAPENKVKAYTVNVKSEIGKKAAVSLDILHSQQEAFSLNLEARDFGRITAPTMSTLRAKLSMKGGLSLENWVSLIANPSGVLFEGDALMDTVIHVENEKILGDGWISLQPFQMQVFPLGTSFSSEHFGLTVKDRHVFVKGNITGAKQGKAEISGKVDIGDSLKEFSVRPDLTVILDSLMPIHTPLYKLVLSGRLGLKSQQKASVLSGRLKVGPSHILLPKNQKQRVSRVEVVYTGAETDKSQVALPSDSDDSMKLNVAVDIPPNFSVRGYGLDSVWSGDMKLAGTIKNPVVEGYIKAKRGTLSMLGSLFKVKKGKVTFVKDKAEVGAFLDVVSSASIKDVIANIRLYGSLNNLSVRLSSVPSMPESEVLSYIVFGKKSASLSPFQMVQLANTISEFTSVGGGSESFLGRIQNQLGLSNLTIDTNNAGDPAVGAGEYLSDNTYLKVSQGITQDETRASIQTDLTDHVGLESEVTSAGALGGGVNLKWKY